MMPILQTEEITYTYPNGPVALSGVSIDMAPGSKIALVGPNGAGKSTLLLMLSGILRPDAGRVVFSGQPLAYDKQSLRNLRRRVGLVFQNPDVQIIAPTVEADVAFGPVNLGFSPDAVRQAVRDALGYVGLRGYEKRSPHHLSGGEKKRVAIAGILAMKPDVLVFDEPTSSLDPASSEEIMELLDELAADGRTVLISTHDVEIAYRWADSVILMGEGKVLARGSPEEVFSDRDLLRSARLKPPILLDLYNELICQGTIAAGAPPKSVLEFTDRITNHEPEKGRAGKIYICDANLTTEEGVRAILEAGAVEHIGVMGTRAREFVERGQISPDFTYGVIEKCILRALNGEGALIITTGGMVEHAQRRITNYCDESRQVIPVVLLPGPIGCNTGREQAPE